MNSRFRPTPYRDLHVGHAWVAWHNWTDAARRGGRFVLILDDIVANLQCLTQQGFSPNVAADRYVEDLAWLGCDVDDVVFSSRDAEAHAEAASLLNLRHPGRWAAENFTGIRVRRACSQEPTNDLTEYHPWLTMTRVVDDFLCKVNSVTRGMEPHLVGEAHHYDWTYRQLYGGNPPRQEYVPLVRRAGAQDKVSKSAMKDLTLRMLRAEGYTGQDVIGTLRECADRGAQEGLRDVVLPEGVLDLPGVKTLRHRGSIANRWLRQVDPDPDNQTEWVRAARAQGKVMQKRLGGAR